MATTQSDAYLGTGYGGAQQKLFPPAYLGIAGMCVYAIYMRNMQSGIFRI